MKTQIPKLFLALTLWNATLAVYAQGTAFTYQGRLNENGSPANGAYDLQFSLRDAVAGGSPVGETNTMVPILVSNGLFTVTLDYGASAFDGNARWLEIGVRPGANTGAYTNLTPRQPVTSTPYAIRAANFGGAVSDAQLSANVARLNGVNQVFSGAVNFSNTSNTFSSAFSGSGAGLNQRRNHSRVHTDALFPVDQAVATKGKRIRVRNRQSFAASEFNVQKLLVDIARTSALHGVEKKR